MNVNKKYKDTVFVKLFSDEERLIELYNAIEGTNYDNSVHISINTLSDVLFMDRKNDISFLFGKKLVVFYEHQSTINWNMALRFLIYVGRAYEKLIAKDAIYRRKQIKIPRPEFIVLYNGTDDYPDYSEIHLSDAFIDASIEKPAIDLTVKIYNINKGKNLHIMQKSRNLDGYATFTAKVREFQAELKSELDSKKALEESIKKAVQWCTKHDILKHFLEENGSEVVNMVFGEWDMDTALEVAKEEGVESVFELLDQGYTVEEAKEELLNRNAYVVSQTQGINQK